MVRWNLSGSINPICWNAGVARARPKVVYPRSPWHSAGHDCQNVAKPTGGITPCLIVATAPEVISPTAPTAGPPEVRALWSSLVDR